MIGKRTIISFCIGFSACTSISFRAQSQNKELATQSAPKTIQRDAGPVDRFKNKGLPPSFYAKGATNCGKFIQQNGTYGPWGKILEKTFNADGDIRKILIDDKWGAVGRDEMLKVLCPGFKTFNSEERVRFWIWTFAAIAWDESKCTENIGGSGPNGRLTCMLQLEDSLELRKKRGPNCRVKSVSKAESCLKCGADSLRAQYHCEAKVASDVGCDPKNHNRGIHGHATLYNSQWEKLRGGSYSSNIKDRLSEFPGCGPKNSKKKDSGKGKGKGADSNEYRAKTKGKSTQRSQKRKRRSIDD